MSDSNGRRVAACALLLAALAPGFAAAASAQSLSKSRSVIAAAAPPSLARKGDRLAPEQGAVRRQVATTRAEGPAHAISVTMRLDDGSLAFFSDSGSAVTSAAKNVDLVPAPAIEAPVGVARPASPAMSGSMVPASGTAGSGSNEMAARAVPLGCERLVSVLVASGERDRIGRCVS